MSVNGDASEQAVRLGLEGFEVTVKLIGSGAKNLLAMLYAMQKDKSQNQTRGKMKLTKMLRTGKPLKIFSISKEDLKTFSKEAKTYGITYCALRDKNSKEENTMIDVIVKDEDASRINRIVEKFKLTTVDMGKVKTEITKAIENRDEKRQELGIPEKSKEQQLEEVLSDKPLQKEQNTNENFNVAKTEKSPLSKPSSMTSKMQEGVSKEVTKPSVKKELAELKIEAEKLDNQKSKEKTKTKAKTNKQKKSKTKTKSNR